MKISREDFKLFERIRKSGKTNMLDTEMVSALSNFQLSKEKVIEILKNYSKYCIRYPGVRK